MNEMRNPYMGGRQERCGCTRPENRIPAPYLSGNRGMREQERMSAMREQEKGRSMRNMPCDKNRFMQNVYELGFVMVETALYLDTHPNDAEALAFYAEMKEKYREAVRLYNENVGPLDFYSVTNENYWSWVATPMPWEMEG